MTAAQSWAKRRNWLLRRLLGALSVFNVRDISFLMSCIRTEAGKQRVVQVRVLLRLLVNEMREIDTYSRYKKEVRKHD